MRRMALLAMTLGCAGATAAGAQTPIVDPRSASALTSAAFAPRSAAVAAPGRFLERGGFKADSLDDVTLVRSWPRALRFSSETLDFDVSPHAGLGVSRFGTQAEGGATLTVSKSRGERALERLHDLGVKDGLSFGDQGRWYLFAAASGRAVGLNMLRGEGGWARGGWTTDQSSTLVGDAQVGVGWRKGPMQTSLGVLHREVKAEHTYFGYISKPDSLVAFSFAVRPER